jgi:hypothetical protein
MLLPFHFSLEPDFFADGFCVIGRSDAVARDLRQFLYRLNIQGLIAREGE